MRFASAAVIVLIVFSFAAYRSILHSLAVSATYTASSQADWEAGEYWNNQLDTTSSSGDLQIKSGGVGSWDAATPGFPEAPRGNYALASEPADIGADLTTDGTYIYIIIGGKEPSLFRYSTDTNTWKQLADAPTDFYYNGAITYYGGYLYAINGHDGLQTRDASNEFWRYDIANNSWSKMATPPGVWGSTAQGGADIESGNNGKLYAIEGSGLANFWIYDTTLNSWTEGTPVDDPVSSANSHALAYSDVTFDVSGTTHCSTGCVYVTIGGGSATFYHYDIGLNQWFSSANAGGTVTSGGAMALDTVNDLLYAFRGGSTEFMRYTPGNPGTWDTSTAQDVSRNTAAGASLVYLGGYFYATFGSVPQFGRYDVTAGKWDSILTPAAQGTNAENLIALVPNGADCADAAGCVFVAQAGGTSLRRFDLTARTWAAALTVVPGALGAGASMCYDGNNNLFISRGSTTDVYPYSISGNSYGTTIAAPAATGVGSSITCTTNDRFYLLRGGGNANFYYYNGTTLAADDSINTNGLTYITPSYGATLANDGTYVYALLGNGRGTFLRFDPAQGSGSRWTEKTNLPTATATNVAGAQYTSVMEYDGSGNLYAIPGKFQKDFWRYNISGNSWTKAADLPVRMARSMGITKGNAAGVMYVMRGENFVGVHKFNYETDPYVPSATWVSAPIDLNFVSSFTSFSATTTTPGSTSLSYASRTSSDAVAWSAWQTITGGTAIQSTAARYIQIKVTLTSDNNNTPTLSAFTITYEKDSTAPTNPTATGYATSARATTITSGSSYYYTNPYFELSSAADAQSGLAGYYVAWSTSSALDPSSSEDYYQTGATYTVNADMQTASPGPTYYLRVATKDKAGNVAAAATLFTYTYTGIASATSKTWTSQGDFDAGTKSNVTSTAGGAIQLSAVTNGAWTTEAPVPGTSALMNGAALASDNNDTVFTLVTSAQTVYAYSITNKTYATKANYGSTFGIGASVVFVPNGAACADASGCLFATRTSGSTDFRRLDISANTWTALTGGGSLSQLPAAASSGAVLAYDGNNTIYWLRGGTTAFYKYSISGNSWTQLTSVDLTVGLGGTLVYVPNGTYCSDSGGCLFSTPGGNTTYFWKYRVSANAWSYIANTPNWIGDGAAAYYLSGAVYLVRGVLQTDFLKYDITSGVWSSLAQLPSAKYYGSGTGIAYVSGTNTMYVLRTSSEYSLLAYDVVNNSWKKSPALPYFYSTNGPLYGVIAYDASSGLVYAGRGNSFSDWWSYNPSTSAWRQLADVPHTLSVGADAEYVNHTTDSLDGIYMLAGTEAQGDQIGYFYRYTPSTDTWTRLANTPAEPGATGGADIVWDGGDAIYTAQGGSTTFYKYVISTNTWSTVVSTIPAAAGIGSCAVRINVGGTDYIYLTRAGGNANVYRFNIGTATWDAGTTVESATGTLSAADACALDGQGNILFPRGTTPNLDMYALDPDGDANGVWTTRATPAFYSYGALVLTANNTILGFRGQNTSAMNRYVVATASTGYQANGTWTSDIFDMGAGVYGFAGLAVTTTAATNASTTVETRTCSDGSCASAGAWTAATNGHASGSTTTYTVASSLARYGQMRVTYTSDQVSTPVVSDSTWKYYADGTAPANPSSASGYTDSGKGTSITTDTWTSDTTPYFEWTASDNAGGIGLSSFYVYFGTNAAKDPVTDAADATNLAYKSGTNVYAVSGGTTGSWDASTQAASTPTSGTYYLKVKTKDQNNNTTATAATIFTYKTDSSNPTDPTSVTASPVSYTATNSFSFSWTASSDGGGSDISQYCYKTNGSDTCVSPGSVCTSGTCTVTGITAYQTRVNTFSVRAKDGAANYSSYASTYYYYAGSPPTAPTNLQVTPSSQTDNNTFTVSWSLPSTCMGQTPCVAADILRYCYTVNVAPSATTCGTNYGGNTTPSADGGWTTDAQTSTRILPTFSAATQQGTNTVYVVAQDAIGNLDYANVASQTFTFTSNAPGPPANLESVDASDRASNRYAVTITWDAPTNLGAGVESYKIFRCTANCTNPSTVDDPPDNYTRISSTSTLGYLDTSLTNTTTYTYLIRAVGPGNNASGNSALVTIKPEGKFKSAPAMSGQPSVAARIRSAVIEWLTLNDTDRDGNAIEHKATSFVQYGTSTGYGSEAGTSDLVNSHKVTITDLTPNTTHHYRTKWVDVDGNIGYSPDFTFITLGAPSAPRNLTVDPATNTANRYAFAWDPPADEGVTVAGYLYTVNNPPTKDNVKFVKDPRVASFAAATQQGTNTFFVVATDDVGNVNYNNYASVGFAAHTEPPSAPQNITITDSSDRNAKRYSITITWDPPTTTASGKPLVTASSSVKVLEEDELLYAILRSEDAGTSFETIATTKSTGYLDAGLDSTKSYTYKVTAGDSAGAASESTTPVTEQPEGRYTSPPTITEAPTSEPDSYSAVVTWRTDRVASSFVLFGTDPEKLAKEQGMADQVETHNVTITGLKPETIYYFKAKSIDVDENEALSELGVIKTLEAPRVLDVKVTDIRLNDAMISWNTNKETTIEIQYGTTTKYGQTYTDTSGTYGSVHGVKLANLSDSTTYHFKLGGKDRKGNPVTSDDYTFTTLTMPKVLSVSTKNKAEGQTEIIWTTNVPTTSTVEYFAENVSPKTQGNTSLVTEHSILLFGLEDATRYRFKMSGTDQFSYAVTSDENDFTTLEDTTPPEVFGVQSESNTLGSGETSKVQIVISWKTNEPTTSQVQYGVGFANDIYSDETEENAELVLDHLAVVSDLAQAKTYHFRVVSRDKAGNRTVSASYSVLTTRKRESFVQLIISNLESTFSWIGNIGNQRRR